jgi:hypothetical protein
MIFEHGSLKVDEKRKYGQINSDRGTEQRDLRE